MSDRPPREYYPAWARIRENRPNEIALLVHPSMVHTVRRMIRKEKNDDLAFKVGQDHIHKAWKLVITVRKLKPDQIRIGFKLVSYMPLKSL